MGWLGYEVNGQSPNQTELIADLVYITSTASGSAYATSMYAAGYVWHEQPFWQSISRTAAGKIQANSNFPDGLPFIMSQVHKAGMKENLYVGVGVTTCGAAAFTGEYDYEYPDCVYFYSLGVDGIDDDWCNPTDGSGNPLDPQTQYTIFSNAMYAAGMQALFNVSEYGINNPQYWAPAISNTWRISGDVDNTGGWGATYGPCALFLAQTTVNFASGAGHWAYGGGLVAGWEGSLSTDQARAGAYMNFFLPEPIWAQNTPGSTSAADLLIIENPETIAINQDAAAFPCGFPVRDYGAGRQIYARPLAAPYHVAVLDLNNNVVTNTAQVNWTDLGFPATLTATVRNAGDRHTVGNLSGSVAESVSATGANIYVIDFSQNYPVPGGWDLFPLYRTPGEPLVWAWWHGNKVFEDEKYRNLPVLASRR